MFFDFGGAESASFRNGEVVVGRFKDAASDAK